MDRTGPELAEEALDRYQPLGAFGQPVYRNHMQMAAALGQRLGERHANFFAVPQLDAQGKRVSWLSPVEGEVRRWSDMTEAEQAERALDLQVMKSEFDAYLEELRHYEQQGQDPRGARAFVAVMEQALRTPNDGHLYFVGDQPVSTFWGFREEESAPFETLTAAPRMAAAAAPVATAGGAVAARRFAWWWLLIPLLLLLALLLWWFWPEDLPIVDESNGGPAVEEPVAVEDEEPAVVDDAERPALIERDGVVVDRDGVVVAPDADGAVVPPDGDLTEGVAIDEEQPVTDDGTATDGVEPDAGENDGAETPETPTPDDQPADGEAPETPEAPEAPEVPETPEQPQDGAGDEGETPEAPTDPGAPPAIPEGASDGAAGFMQGQWSSDSGLVDSQTKQKLTQEYNFDESGKGEAVIRRADGVTCRAPAEATVRDGDLRVEEKANLTCSDGSSFKRSTTVCTKSPTGKAECIGTDADGNRFKVDLNRGGQP